MAPEVRMGFGTLARENISRSPSEKVSDNLVIHKLIEPHIASFNAITDQSLLDNAVKNLDTRSLRHASSGAIIRFWIEDVQIGKPMLSERESYSLERRIFPAECRQRGTTYEGKMVAKLCFQVNDGETYSYIRPFGNVPVMVRSNCCHLEGLSPTALIRHHEEAEEWGGYFIVNGIERLVRLLIVTRRNYPLGVIRQSFVKKGSNYTPYGIIIRCVRDDATSQTISLHYLSDIGMTVRFSISKQEYLVPVLLILRALAPLNDKHIFEGVTLNGSISDAVIRSRLEAMLRSHRTTELYSQAVALEFLGARFQAILRYDDEMSEREIGILLLRKYLFVHLDDNHEKITLLFMMMRKLLAMVGGLISPENADSPMCHELLLPGHLYVGFLKEKLDELLTSLRTAILVDGTGKGKRKVSSVDEITLETDRFCKRMLGKIGLDIGKKIKYFLATGNMPTMTGMDLQQTSGYSIVAERLNHFRYLSHFRSVHRGAFFATLKTTTVRKLLPEAWGFLCPVHTPDGTPCGLLNHLSHRTLIVADQESFSGDRSAIASLLLSLGLMIQPSLPLEASADLFTYEVVVDGSVIGWIPSSTSLALVASELRRQKGKGVIPRHAEIVHIPPPSTSSQKGLYPGLFIFTSPARLMRPVERIASGEEELIGILEQVYLSVALPPSQLTSPTQESPGAEHREIAPTAILSVVANLTPFCDFNQSPRNMYQCQMAKQSMGTPCHALPYRADSKLYRLQSGQSPIVRTRLYDTYQMDTHPNGINAVVAVISYTGYDMEDAMIINKSAFERGFANGSIYKTELINLGEKNEKEGMRIFGCTNSHYIEAGILESDGLPPVGRVMRPDEPLYSYVVVGDDGDTVVDERLVRWKAAGLEEAYIDSIRIIGDEIGGSSALRALVLLRVPRAPVIGDKFASRHGQKGVCSQRWPLVDMPFSDVGGITPDIIINPHAFPSRMTIGMFIESMAGKAGAMGGYALDATPFQITDKAVETFGEMLRQTGFSYYGNETLYSGIFGNELSADIFIGCVYYQRLRHMVSDKFQVRTTGPVHNLTRQPIKGRKRAGGIRFGEMERDSMLAHGSAFLLHDRLMNCSDYTQMHACMKCGDILSILFPLHHALLRCTSCGASGPSSITVVALPYVYRYLATELMAMNVRLKMDFSATGYS